jgi:urease accessory protein
MALISKVHIQTALREGKTFLQKSFCSPPFKIADVTEDKSQGHLQLMLMSSSPGVLNGDEYTFQIDIAENSSLQLRTQSYQRLFQMQKGAKQLMDIHLEPGASLDYIPHPLVPHENSIFFANNKIYLSNDSSLTWGEVMSCGRKLNGEVFKLSSYHSITEIFKNDRLVVRENLLIKPAEVNPFSIGQLENYTHQAGLIFINEKVGTSALFEELNQYLALQSNISFGVSFLHINGLIVRLLGYKAEQLFDLLKHIGAVCNGLNHNQLKVQKLHVYGN